MTDTNRDPAIASVWPLVACRDARKLTSFLVDALGFESPVEMGEKDGIVTRAELRWPIGLGGVVLREPHPTYPQPDEFRNAFPSGPAAVYLYASDVEAVHRRAAEAGAEIIRSLRYASDAVQAFAVRDPEGNLWSIADLAMG